MMEKRVNRDGFQMASTVVNISQLVTNGMSLVLQIVGLFRKRSPILIEEFGKD